MGALLTKGALAALLFSVPAASVDAQRLAAPPGIDWTAKSFSYDGSTSRGNFTGLKISQNDLSIAADSATVDALDFKRSTWQLRGDVRIKAGTAEIASDEALLTVRDDMLATIELRGDPATFKESEPAGAEKIEGHANRLFFDQAKRTLTLAENAWLNVGGNEVRGCDLIFDLDAESFSSGTTDCGEDFHFKAAPPPAPQASGPRQ